MSCLGIGKRIERGGLSVKERREERGKGGTFGKEVILRIRGTRES